MKNRFQLITVYEDLATKSESTSDITAALNAAAIYQMDPDCIRLSIYDWQNKKDILTYEKPE